MTKKELEQILKEQNKNLQKVFDDSTLFKLFLELDEKVYNKWNNIETAGSILLGMIIGGLLGGGIVFFLGMGMVQQILFILGISNPFTWPVILGALAGGLIFYGKDKLIQKLQKDLFHVIPKRINTPLDYVGEQVIEALLVELPSLENEKCLVLFFKKQGYNEEFVKFKINQVKNNKNKFQKNNYEKIINKIGEKENISDLYSILKRKIKEINC